MEEIMERVLSVCKSICPLDRLSGNLTMSQAISEEKATKDSLIRDLQGLTDDDIYDMNVLRTISKRNPLETSLYLSTIFLHFSRRTDEIERCKAGILTSISLIQEGFIENQHSRSLLEHCQTAIKSLAPAIAPDFVGKLLEPLEFDNAIATKGLKKEFFSATGFISTLDLLPKLFCMILSLEHVVDTKDIDTSHQRDLSGTEFCDKLISKICQAHWPESCGVGIIRVLKDISLNDSQLKSVSIRAIRHLKSRTDLHSIPPLVYQLLLLASHGSRELILSGLYSAFDELNKISDAVNCKNELDDGDSIRPVNTSRQELVAMQGTVLLHCDAAMRQDHELAACVLKRIKREIGAPFSARDLSPFRFALILTLARVQRFNVPSMNALRDLIVELCAYSRRRAGCRWFDASEFAALAKGPEVLPTKSGPYYTIRATITRVIEWGSSLDFLLPSLKDLGVSLLNLGKTTVAPFSDNNLMSSVTWNACNDASEIGYSILLETFEYHELSQKSIMEEIRGCIKSGDKSPNLYGYLKLLSAICNGKAGHMVLDHTSMLKDILGYLRNLNSYNVIMMLKALTLPLKLRPQLQDYAILPLRKAMFSPIEDTRISAARGIVELMKLHEAQDHDSNEYYSLSFSQRQRLSGTSIGSNSNFSIAEGSGLLRRCLTQQGTVRYSLYDSFFEAYNGKKMGIFVVETLSCHLHRYLSLNLPIPLNLRKATDETYNYNEPLPVLIGFLSYISNFQSKYGCQANSKNSLCESLKSIEQDLWKLTKALINVEPVEFGIDVGTEFHEGGNDNMAVAILLVGCYESLMGNASRKEMNDEVMSIILNLMEKRKRVENVVLQSMNHNSHHSKDRSKKNTSILKDKNGEKKESDRNNKARQKAPFNLTGSFHLTLQPNGLPCFGTSFVTNILSYFVEDSSEVEVESLSPLHSAKQDVNLRRLVLATANVHLEAILNGAAFPGTFGGEIGGCDKNAGTFSFEDERTHSIVEFCSSIAAKTMKMLLILQRKNGFEPTLENDNNSNADPVEAERSNGSIIDSEDGNVSKISSKTKKKSSGKEKKINLPAESLSESCLKCFESCIKIVSSSALNSSQESGFSLLTLLQIVRKINFPDKNDSVLASIEVIFELIEELIEKSLIKEAVLLLNVLNIIASKLPHMIDETPNILKNYAILVETVCNRIKSNSAPIVKAFMCLLLQSYILAGSSQGDLIRIASITERIRICLGPLDSDIEDDDELNNSNRHVKPINIDFTSITEKTAPELVDVVLATIEECICGCDLALSVLVKEAMIFSAKISASENLILDDESGPQENILDGAPRDEIDRREAYLVARLRLLFESIEPLLRSAVSGRNIERIISLVTRLLKILSKILKFRVNSKRQWVLSAMDKCLRQKRTFCARFQDFLTIVSDNSTGKRNTRLMPELVYQLEQCDALVLKLAGLTRLDSSKWVYRNTARDFRIQHKDINRLQAKAAADEEKKASKRIAKDKLSREPKKKETKKNLSAELLNAEDNEQEEFDEDRYDDDDDDNTIDDTVEEEETF